MFVVFDKDDQPVRASLEAGTPPEQSFAISRELYVEIQTNATVLRELAIVRTGNTIVVQRLTNIPRLNQTMMQVPYGADGDIILTIRSHGMAMEYGPRIRKASTHEWLFSLGSALNPLCDPVRLSHGTLMQMEYILPAEKLPFKADLFRKANVFVSRPHVDFRYSYYLDL